MRRRRTWRQAGCYVWRTRKPSAPIGLPFIGRHFAYVGETGSRWHRDKQHVFGDVERGQEGKPWSDLDPKVYALPCLFPNSAWCRKKQETLWTCLLWPVYPVKKNKWNPRRIKPHVARMQRLERDKAPVFSAVARMVFRWGVGLSILVLAGAVYGGFFK